ncbi:MAG: hypothetical protein LWX09_09240 [Bacteroidia bacterium]|nr:hypothetical protein [Bacteroidia bacterium]
MYRPQPREEIKKRKRIFVYIIFLAVSSLLWLLIKLNNVYTVKMPVTLHFSDPPAGIWLDDEYREQQLETELQARGFILLRVVLTNKKEPVIHTSLRSLSPRKINQNEYYLTAQSLKSLVASHLNLNAEEVMLADNELRFRANPLASKKLKVVPNLEISYDQRFGPYGPPQTYPDSLDVYAIKQVLDTLKFITTEKASYKNVRSSISDSLKLLLTHPSMSVQKNKVYFELQVEQYTETHFIVDVEPVEGANLRIFPNRTTIILNVALKDYDKLGVSDFQVEVDTSGLAKRNSRLFLKVSRMPSNAQLVRLDPDKVEYLITSAR